MISSAICGLWKFYECWFIPNCTRKTMWLLVNNIHAKIWLAFPLLRLTACQKSLLSLLQLTTSTKIGLNFERWILMAKITEAKLEICLPRTQALCHFKFLTFHVFPLPTRKEIQLLTRFLCIVVLCLLGFWLRKVSQQWWFMQAFTEQ